MLVHYAIFYSCSVSALHHIHMVQSLCHMLMYFTLYRHHVHMVHTFHSKEHWYSDNSREFYYIKKIQYQNCSILILFITLQFINLLAIVS